QRTGAAAILIVYFSVDVVCIRQINQFGAGLEVAIIPAVQAHAGRTPWLRLGKLLQVLEHKLAGVEAEALLAQRDLHRSAERHELCLNARKLRNRADGKEHLVEQPLSDGGLRKFRRYIKAADQAFLLLQDIKGITRSTAVFESDASRESVGVQKPFDQLQ